LEFRGSHPSIGRPSDDTIGNKKHRDNAKPNFYKVQYNLNLEVVYVVLWRALPFEILHFLLLELLYLPNANDAVSLDILVKVPLRNNHCLQLIIHTVFPLKCPSE